MVRSIIDAQLSASDELKKQAPERLRKIELQ